MGRLEDMLGPRAMDETDDRADSFVVVSDSILAGKCGAGGLGYLQGWTNRACRCNRGSSPCIRLRHPSMYTDFCGLRFV